MRRGWKSRAVLLICACLAGGAVSPLAPPASLGGPRAAAAQEAPPAVSAAAAVEAAITAARKLMTDGKWKDAEAAWKALLASRPNDPTVSMHFAEIEDGLRRSVFRPGWGGPDIKGALGPAAMLFDPKSRIVKFETSTGFQHEGWVHTERVFVFDRPFEDQVAVEFDWDAHRGFAPEVLLAYDPARQSGYQLTLGGAFEEPQGVRVVLPGITRIDEGKMTEIGRSAPGSSKLTSPVRFERGPSSLCVRTGGRDQLIATDSRYRDGMIAIVRRPGMPHSLRITGKLPAEYVRWIRAEAEDRAMGAWEARGWRREEFLPAWILEAERRSRRSLESMPAPAQTHAGQSDARVACATMLRKYWEGDRDAFTTEAAAWSHLDPPSKQYVAGVGQLIRADWPRAIETFASLRESSPGFAPALTGLAWARFGQGQREQARRDLAAALALDPIFPASHQLAVRIALADGDAAAARAALDAAASEVVLSPCLRGLARAVTQVERGPAWPSRFERRTEHFDIASDHSAAACVDVGTVLEEAHAGYRAAFRTVPASKRRMKVFDFAHAEGFREYASGDAADAWDTTVAYMPVSRQLVVRLHSDRAELRNTLRHEAHRQHLHQFAEYVPPWLDEGSAELFGFSRRKTKTVFSGPAGDCERDALRLYVESFTPLEELLLMERPRFMATPHIHHVQAWSVVHFLRETKDPQLAGILDRYLDALIAGKGRTGAYDQVLKPVLPAISQKWLEHITALIR